MKYKKQIATGALALSLLIGGSSVFAETPQDLGIKNPQSTFQKHNNNKNSDNTKSMRRKNVTGTISIINDTGFILEIKNIKSKNISSVDIKTDTKTIYSRNGLVATATDLAVGQKVVVSGSFDKIANTLIAKSVKIATKNLIKNKK